LANQQTETQDAFALSVATCRSFSSSSSLVQEPQADRPVFVEDGVQALVVDAAVLLRALLGVAQILQSVARHQPTELLWLYQAILQQNNEAIQRCTRHPDASDA